MKAQRLKDVDLTQKISDKDEYERVLKRLQFELLLVQRQLYQHRQRAVLVFEGWDAAGKGGSIRRLTQRLDPRGFAVHPVGAPNEDEKSRHYLHRFWVRLPAAGCIGIFDRSWYGRVLVERVEGLCEREAWARAYDEINAFEKMLTDDGVPVVKCFLHISPKEQLKRFHERENDPFKSWKISKDDWRNRKHWKDYEEAIDDMFAETSTKHAPWRVVPAEHKWFGRSQVLKHVTRDLARFFDFSLKAPKGWRVKP